MDLDGLGGDYPLGLLDDVIILSPIGDDYNFWPESDFIYQITDAIYSSSFLV